ncbi:hypothetical protein HDV06_002078 [Boothiomyces sp. JEL0866]|nr:hypothetical protein HDV06_002078 [Boothiomyces sp. JEL0866]
MEALLRQQSKQFQLCRAPKSYRVIYSSKGLVEEKCGLGSNAKNLSLFSVIQAATKFKAKSSSAEAIEKFREKYHLQSEALEDLKELLNLARSEGILSTFNKDRTEQTHETHSVETELVPSTNQLPQITNSLNQTVVLQTSNPVNLPEVSQSSGVGRLRKKAGEGDSKIRYTGRDQEFPNRLTIMNSKDNLTRKTVLTVATMKLRLILEDFESLSRMGNGRLILNKLTKAAENHYYKTIKPVVLCYYTCHSGNETKFIDSLQELHEGILPNYYSENKKKLCKGPCSRTKNSSMKF